MDNSVKLITQLGACDIIIKYDIIIKHDMIYYNIYTIDGFVYIDRYTRDSCEGVDWSDGLVDASLNIDKTTCIYGCLEEGYDFHKDVPDEIIHYFNRFVRISQL